MKRAAQKLVDRVLELMRDPNQPWQRFPIELDLPAMRFDVYPSGDVRLYGLGRLPMDYAQRRSIARAYKRLHKRLTEELVELGTKVKGAPRP